MTTVAELMTADVPHLSAHCALEHASHAMDQSKTDALPLCDPDGRLLGMVTRHNISRASRSLGELADSLRAQHLMNPDPPTIGLHDTVEKAMAQMAIHQTRHLPVLNGQRVCGMLTSAQIGHQRPAVNVEELVHHVKLPAEHAPASSSSTQ
ncbi:CBS domain-containing protein [Nesterenkonia halotolerans]|uniref:CBS domain-containing protein n=1 Tax=Nesterenkonia halotolerans TaxID=225325 RepID=A0ABR9J833_9MICC|nr:CBS domain-containing protein [Nesterenkonia halotolerans]MBE1515164.1 CBS domain-containing protein [Nesterenkonia halotolerans]